MRTLRTLGWVCWLFGYMIGKLPVSWRAKRMEKRGEGEKAYALICAEVQKWARKLLHHIKANIAVYGIENLPAPGEPVLYVANHQSYVDIPVLLAALTPPPPLMSRHEVGKVPVLGEWMRILGCVFVERGDARSGMIAMREGEKVLKSGRSLVVFPEGTRSKSDEVGSFMPGAVHIAAKAGVRIVPIALDGTYKALEKNGYRIAPADIRVSVLPPVETSGLDRVAQKALPQQIENTLREEKAQNTQRPMENALF